MTVMLSTNYPLSARHPLHQGIYLGPDGVAVHSYFKESDISTSTCVPIRWKGRRAMLCFWDTDTEASANAKASSLVAHLRIVIFGPAYVIRKTDLWYRMEVFGDARRIQKAWKKFRPMSDTIRFQGTEDGTPHEIYAQASLDILMLKAILAAE